MEKRYYRCGQCEEQFAAANPDVMSANGVVVGRCPSCGSDEIEYDKYDIRMLDDDQYPNVSFGETEDEEWEVTAAQAAAIFRKWKQNHNYMSWSEFAKTARMGMVDNVVVIKWCGMFLAIETDGYTHS